MLLPSSLAPIHMNFRIDGKFLVFEFGRQLQQLALKLVSHECLRRQNIFSPIRAFVDATDFFYSMFISWMEGGNAHDSTCTWYMNKHEYWIGRSAVRKSQTRQCLWVGAICAWRMRYSCLRKPVHVHRSIEKSFYQLFINKLHKRRKMLLRRNLP